MYTDIPLALSLLFVVGGLVVLAWSSDLFVEASAKFAKMLGVSPFVIGMVIIGFGTSAPELCVSALSGASGHSNIALGNAYGSCSFNILAILGVAALIRPVLVQSSVVLLAVPLLLAISGCEWLMLKDGCLSSMEGLGLVLAFAVIMPVYCWYDQHGKADAAKAAEVRQEAPERSAKATVAAVARIVVGLSLLISSSHVLVWGSVDLARAMGVSELLIGLTIVAIGTSLPELSSAVASVRRGEHEFVTGNIIGSNLFNMLAVVGIASLLSPIEGFSKYVVSRDLSFLFAATALVAIFGMNRGSLRGNGRLGRLAGGIFILLFAGYSVLMMIQEAK